MEELQFLREMARLSAQVRHYQVHYFATRSSEVLKVCKKLETKLDAMHLSYADRSYSQSVMQFS